MIISSYQIDKINKINVIKNDDTKSFYVDGYEVRDNLKGDLSCDCKWFSDGKKIHKPCTHILAVYKKYLLGTYSRYITESRDYLEKELNKINKEIENVRTN